MGDDDETPKYQLEDILNRKKPPPQILDLYKTQSAPSLSFHHHCQKFRKSESMIVTYEHTYLSFLDTQVSLALSLVSLSVRKSVVRDTIEFPFCQRP